MTKIGTLTFQNTTNYGAVLQALALQHAIKKVGGETEIINYHCENIERREYYVFPKFEKNLLNYAKKVKAYFSMSNKKKIINKFISKNMTLSKKEYNRNTISEANKLYDKFLVGSDMVFNLDITDGDMTYYLDFAESDKRYSYAASLGVEAIPDKYLENCVENLNKFKHVSVREEQTQKYFDSILKCKTSFNVDPTLLHDGDFWKNYEETPNNIPEKYILLYFLDKENVILETAQKIAKENDCKIIILGNLKKNYEGVEFIPNASVGEFLYYIHHAELVITGSYHGMIFSMNYNTNFMYFNRANSSRMESIAKLTNSQDRRLTKEHLPNLKCDFNKINHAVEKMRNDSIEYLKSLI